MEAASFVHWFDATHCGVVLLSSARLGHSHQLHHGRVCLSDSPLEHARNPGAPLEILSTDVVLDVVHGRRVLLDLLALQEPRGSGSDAVGKCTGFTVAVLDVRAGLVLPWHPGRNVGRATENQNSAYEVVPIFFFSTPDVQVFQPPAIRC